MPTDSNNPFKINVQTAPTSAIDEGQDGMTTPRGQTPAVNPSTPPLPLPKDDRDIPMTNTVTANNTPESNRHRRFAGTPVFMGQQRANFAAQAYADSTTPDLDTSGEVTESQQSISKQKLN